MTDAPTSPRAAVSLTDLAVERLETLPDAGKVLGLLDLQRVTRKGREESDPLASLPTPAVVVMAVEDRAGPNQVRDPDAGGVLQEVTSRISVIVGVSAPNDLGGRLERTHDRLAAAVAAVRARLVAWTPGGPFGETAPHRWEADAEGADRWRARPGYAAPGWTPVELRRGRLLQADGRAAWWEDQFEAARLMRGAAAPVGADPFAPVADVRPHVRLPADAAPEEIAASC